MASNATPKPQTQQPSAQSAKAPDAAAGNCSAATGFGLRCHQRERRGEQELWALALLVQKEKNGTEGNQLYFSSLIKGARGFACSSAMFSTSRYMEQGAAADQS